MCKRMARIQKIERPVDGVMILYLKPAANEPLQILPGQYIELQLADGKRRSFSLANAPHDAELLQLHVRHIAGGAFTDALFGITKERDILQFQVRDSAFYLREQSSKPVLFVASGTGFAPAKAMIEHANARGIARPMTLYWGGRRPKDLYLSALPRKWAAERSDFRFVPVVSDALPEDAWSGRNGFVHRAVVEDGLDLSGYQVYACGVPAMVDAARRDFTTQCGLPENEFYSQ